MAGHSKWSEIKRQKGADELGRRREIAIAACRKMIANADRPLFRLTVECDDGSWFYRVPKLFGAIGEVRRRRDLEADARALIALWLEVEPDTFDIEIPAG
jgi:hypothetical protein